MDLEKVVVKFQADLEDVKKALADLERKSEGAAKRVAKSFDDVGKKLQRFGTYLSLGLTTPLVAFGKSSIDAASRAEELRNLIDVTFGDASGSVQEFSKDAAAAMQRSSTAVLNTTGDFAKFLDPLLEGDKAFVTMSKSLAALTTDLSSFQNISEEEAAIRLFSGLAGETEAVRRLGIDLGQTALAAELASLGYKGNAQEASQAQKAVARYNLIIKQTQKAQGDAVRTAGSYENQSRALGAAFRDLREDIGNRLLPVATELETKITRGIRGFLGMSDAAKETAGKIALFAAALGPGLLALGTLVRALGFAAKPFAPFGRLFLKLVSTLGGGAKKLITIFGTLPLGLTAAVAATAGLAIVFRKTLVGMVQDLGPVLRGLFKNQVTRPLLLELTFLRDKLPESAQKVFDAVFGKIEVPKPANVSKEFNKLINDAIRNSGKDVEEFKRELVSVGGAALDALPPAVREILEGIATGFQDVDIGADDAAKALEDLYSTLSDLPTTGAAAAGELVKQFDALAKSVRTPKEELRDQLAEIQKLDDAMSELGPQTQEVFDVFVRARKQATDAALEAERDANGVNDLLDTLGEGLGSAFESAVSQGQKFGDVLKGLEQDLIRLAVRKFVTTPLLGGLESAAKYFGFAHGGVVNEPYRAARGAVVARPTLLAGGAAIAGERPGKKEGVLPLANVGGDLGVRASFAGSGRPIVNVVVNAPPGTTAREGPRRQTGPNTEEITLFIDQAGAELLSRPGTRMHRALKTTFGAAVQTVSR